jgi:hypothetical protein
LPPQGASGEAAGRADFANLVTGGKYRLENKGQLLAYPFKCCPDEVRPAVRTG